MAQDPAGPAQAPPGTLRFAPSHSCGGLVAAVGLLLFAIVGLATTLPGFPVAPPYPPWLVWTLRVAPLPALLLLWAVVHEAEFKIRTDPSAIHFRQPLGPSTRVPWREVLDYFADCGRSVRVVATSGESLVDDPTDAEPRSTSPPFGSYGPDYIIVSSRGAFVFDADLAEVNVLSSEVVRHAPEEAPDRWEEASWVSCQRCGERTAVSLWRLPPGHSVRYCDQCRAPDVVQLVAVPPPACACGGEFALENFVCPACDEPLAEALAAAEEGLIVERRGLARRPRAWPTVSAPTTELESAADEGAEGNEPG